ncbi:MAG: hypothetical protein M1823_000153 [Watsoniomyces obsoletus]|nr:MAG: hypothetical protein M1823_000153 [Watsoniomyces obsoletus]
MPEAFTYHDMARMIKARIRDEGADYQLVLHPCFSQMVYKTSVPKSQRKAGGAKGKQMIKHPEWFEPDPSKGSYRNLKALSGTEYTMTRGDGLDIMDAPTSMSFRIRPEDVRSHGKNLVISLRPDLHIRVHCFLHGHVLPMSTAKYTATTRRWHKSGASIRATPPHIPVAIIGKDWNIVVVDHNRLTQTTFIKGPDWRDPTRGPCPITEPARFRSKLMGVPLNGAPADKRIYNWIIGDQKLFNGMGTSHTNEVLHRVWIHPDTPARTVWASSKTGIIDEMLKYCQIALSQEYCHFVRPSQMDIPLSRSRLV